MLALATGTKVFLATEPVDLRRGHDGLCSLVKNTLTLDPFAGHLFVFIGRRGDRVKVLFWDRGGFVLYFKRLARGRFRMPRVPEGADRVVLDGTELAMLLGGFDVARAPRAAAWEPSSKRRPAAQPAEEQNAKLDEMAAQLAALQRRMLGKSSERRKKEKKLPPPLPAKTSAAETAKKRADALERGASATPPKARR